MAAILNDIDCLSSLDPYFTEVGGRTALIQRCARRIQTPRGSNPADVDNYGMNIRDWLNRNMTPKAIFVLESSVEEELVKEVEVKKVTAKGRLDSTGKFTLDVRITDEQGQFQLELTTAPIDADAYGSPAESEEVEVATKVSNVDSKAVTVTTSSQPHLAALTGRGLLTVQNTSKVTEVYYQFGKNCTTASLVIPAGSQRTFDPVSPEALYLMTPSGTALVKIEWGW